MSASERGSVSEPPALIADRYRLRHVVGSGGMGIVWEAWDERLERRVALKQLHRQTAGSPAAAELANKRAMREARLTARLNHPHAVPVYDVVEQQGQLWLIMQFIPSVTLAAVLEEVGPLEPDEAAKVGAQVASALTAAHAVGIVHRDVKPGNVLIADDGTALISDFGIAYALGDATLTSSGMIHGTPAYLAPEVARGMRRTSPRMCSPSAPRCTAQWRALRRSAGTRIPWHCCIVWPPGVPSSAALRCADARDPADAFGRSGSPSVHAGRGRHVGAGRSAQCERDRPDGRSERIGGDAYRRGDRSGTHKRSELGEDRPIDNALARFPRGVSARGLAQHSTKPRRNRGIAAAVAIIALIGVGILIAALLPDDRRAVDPTTVPDQSSSAAPESTEVSSPPQAPAPRASSTQPQDSSPPRDSPRPAAPRTKAPAPSRAPSPTTAPTVQGAPTAAQLRRAITSYYALMPGNTDAAWPRMTASYQTNHAGGRQAYQQFWDAVSRITVANVRGIPPRSAQATLTYYFKDGRVVRERTAYGLVNDEGRLRINSTTVLSSVTL